MLPQCYVNFFVYFVYQWSLHIAFWDVHNRMFTFYMLLYDMTLIIYRTYKTFFGPGSVQQIMPYFSNSGYSGSLVTWTVVRQAAAKFKPRMFYRSGFVLSSTVNIAVSSYSYSQAVRRLVIQNHGKQKNSSPGKRKHSAFNIIKTVGLRTTVLSHSHTFYFVSIRMRWDWVPMYSGHK